jgi:membrane dipeptidase
VFYALGVRYALLAYNQHNHVGGGGHERSDGGLSRFGRELIRQMQDVGMLVDCSHTGARTAEEAFDMATRPMIYSHANARAVFDHERNISDHLARACVATGGMVGVNGIGWFLGADDNLGEALFRHTDHWVQLLGDDHVGIGLDSVTDVAATVAAMKLDPARWPADQGYQTGRVPACGPEVLTELTERMLQAGYGDGDCRNILGGNWLRLARKVWN